MATEDSIYDEIEIEDMTYDPTLQIYHYPCPCGDRFEVALDDLREGETDIAPEAEGGKGGEEEEVGLQQQQQQSQVAVAA
ncbi:hypothetical protein B0A50_01137 [Salinomyces thailandicus]|uniref:Diphthamide biosynthesis protein 3 n=1 Tax=Salinomyces thailandicus TaxID=706561 RepID=A0A4U0UBR8_9PEZI|nr:hypothetical protein B0A50_01137 [Salinomyces thailandica]